MDDVAMASLVLINGLV